MSFFFYICPKKSSSCIVLWFTPRLWYPCLSAWHIHLQHGFILIKLLPHSLVCFQEHHWETEYCLGWVWAAVSFSLINASFPLAPPSHVLSRSFIAVLNFFFFLIVDSLSSQRLAVGSSLKKIKQHIEPSSCYDFFFRWTQVFCSQVEKHWLMVSVLIYIRPL